MEDNKLIAEFMGLVVSDRENYTSELHTNVDADLKYHTSWDWLMPVVEKISDIKHWSINATLDWLSESQDRDGLYEKEDVYKAVVEFINQNK
tara:strand:+ start:1304 stop:1579 length:276 start_codon:yes stop_codon:yes gene_type:complete